jgi:ferredoxin-type protein NapH
MRFLLARRASQLGILALFLAGPWFGLWIVKGNLASSLTLDFLPLTDPYVYLQSLFAGHLPARQAAIGAAIVALVYLAVGGRMYCAWVCPLNLVTDVAAWLRATLNLKGGAQFSREARYWILGMTLVVAAVNGSLAWEMVNPVSMVQRALIFGLGAAWLVVLAVFVLDVFVGQRAWCGHLCPVGAFYSLLGRWSVLRVVAARRESCNDCNDCYRVCPEPQVITPALRGRGARAVLSPNCTNCGRCIEVCAPRVFEFGSRFERPGAKTISPIQITDAKEVS